MEKLVLKHISEFPRRCNLTYQKKKKKEGARIPYKPTNKDNAKTTKNIFKFLTHDIFTALY